MTRVLVTGAGGFVGSVLMTALKQRGDQVVGTGRKIFAHAGAGSSFYQADLAVAEDVERLFAEFEFDAVIHCAARVRGDSESVFYRDNVKASENVVDAARRSGVKKLIYLSTISVYSGEGPFLEDSQIGGCNFYGVTKQQAEEVCLSGLPGGAIILRLGGIHGLPRNDGFFHSVLSRALAGDKILVNEPDTEVTPTFIDDVLTVVSQFIEWPRLPDTHVFNLATAEHANYLTLAKTICDLTQSKSEILCQRPSPRRNRVLDTTRIRAVLPTSLPSLSAHIERLVASRGKNT